ncbi:FtsX-like permease family protein [Streptomyces polyrhachis]|uniref:FtsX-like permease family protein n=1 Tax=Streptomyces polyrhachis TaxID=1282885 RepID=A0ABW2GB78_9ACTN
MKVWLRGWRASLRIARRDAVRNKGRSALVLSMIALPIMGVGAVDIIARSSDGSTEQQLTREIGAADARLAMSWSEGRAIYQKPDPRLGGVTEVDPPDEGKEPPSGKPADPADPASWLPAGATVVKSTEDYGRVRTSHGVLYSSMRELDASSPLVEGMLTRLRGEYPDKPGEVAATQAFLDESGLFVGSKTTVRDTGRTYRITGAYELPADLRRQELLGVPGDLVGIRKARNDEPPSFPSYLVSLPGGMDWERVKELNTHGVEVVSRQVILDPPPDSQVPYYQSRQAGMDGGGNDDTTLVVTIAATVAALAMLEICLLAGPAFAVGARRSRRQLGLVGANGGDRRHIRAIVLGGGLVIGLAAAVVGLTLGLALTLAFQPMLEDLVGKRFGGLRLEPLELAGIAVLAVVTGLLAAIVPAITASRQTPLASLTGRRGVRRTGRLLPTLGLCAVALGATVALYGAMASDSMVLIALGSGLAELGVVALTPLLIGAFGRFGRWLPLSPRLALRDAVRNRGRTAPAVAAVLAAVAGTVAVATFVSSDEEGQRLQYEAQLPDGMVRMTSYNDNGADRDAAGAAVVRTLPIGQRADFGQLVSSPADKDAKAEDLPPLGVAVPKANECPLHTDENGKLTAEQRRKLIKTDWRCNVYNGYTISRPTDAVVGGAALLDVFGVKDPAAKAALAAGKAVVFDRKYLDAEGVHVTAESEEERSTAETTAIPGYRTEMPGGAWIGVLVPESAVRAAGLESRPLGAYFTTTHLPSSAQKQAYEKEVDKRSLEADLYVEQGFVPENGFVQLGLLLFASLVTIGAAGIATGLAQADAEADLRTLAAVGAAPRVRRTLSGMQCAAVAAMGVVLGTAAGILPAAGLRLAQQRLDEKSAAAIEAMGDIPYGVPAPLLIPWDTIALLLVAVPLGAGLLAALVTSSKPALARRAEA